MSTLEIVRPGKRETLQWNEGNAQEVADARERFKAEMGVGGLAYRTVTPGKSEQIRDFDPEARSMTITSPLVGG